MKSEKKAEKILSLAYEISRYHLNTQDVDRLIKRIEKKFGDFNLPCDLSEYPDTADETLLEELNTLVHQGVCSKEIILKMSTIANNLHPELIEAYRKKKFCFYCIAGIIIVVALILGVCLII